MTASTSLAHVAWEMTYAPKDPGPRLAATCDEKGREVEWSEGKEGEVE